MKRITSLLAVAALLAAFALSTGCNTAETPGSTAGGDNDAGIPTEFVGEGANGDENLRIRAYKPTSDTVTHLTADAGSVDLDNEKLQALYGCKVVKDVVASNMVITELNKRVLAGNPPDLVTEAFPPSLMTRNLVLPLDDYINFEDAIWDDVQQMLDVTLWEGKHYMAPLMMNRTAGVWYNTDLFEEYDVTTPLELYQAGNWNWDTFLETAKAMTVDKDHDSTPDIYGVATEEHAMFLFSTGKDLVTIEDGKAVNNLRSEDVARAVTFYNDLYSVHNVASPTGVARERFLANEVAMYPGALWERDPMQEMMKEGKLMIVPCPKDPTKDTYYVSDTLGGFYIPRGAKNIPGAAAYICLSRQNQLDDATIERQFNELHETIGYTREIEDMFRNEIMNPEKISSTYTFWSTFDLGTYWGDIWSRPHVNGEPWSKIVEELYPLVDEKIKMAYQK